MGILFVLSAPSGAGKTSLIKKVVSQDSSLELSVSYTTRDPRSNEVHGKDYYFVDDQEFESMRLKDEFLEYATVFENSYGTSKAVVSSLLAEKDVLLEIDWQGALQVKSYFDEVVWVFILPPSFRELADRLHNRRTNSESDLNLRLDQVVSDIEYAKQSDYVIVNEDLDCACGEFLSIVNSERLKSARQIKVIDDIIKSK